MSKIQEKLFYFSIGLGFTASQLLLVEVRPTASMFLGIAAGYFYFRALLIRP